MLAAEHVLFNHVPLAQKGLNLAAKPVAFISVLRRVALQSFMQDYIVIRVQKPFEFIESPRVHEFRVFVVRAKKKRSHVGHGRDTHGKTRQEEWHLNNAKPQLLLPACPESNNLSRT